MKRLASSLVVTSMLTLGAAFVACDSDDTTPTIKPGDGGAKTDTGGGGDGSTTDGGGELVQKGKIAGLGATAPSIAGATVIIQGKTATTDSRGEYSIPVTPGQPFFMRVQKSPDFYSVLEQEWSIAATTDRGRTAMIDSTTAALLTQSLPGFNSALGALAIIAVKTGACGSTGGAQVNVTCNGNQRCFNPPQPDGGGGDGGGEGGLLDASLDVNLPETGTEGGAGEGGGDGGGLGLGPRHPFIAYFRGAAPNPAATDVEEAASVSAIAWNLPVGNTVELRIAKPDGSCQMKAFPVVNPGEGNPAVGAFTYTGKVQIEAANGNIVSAGRVFLQ